MTYESFLVVESKMCPGVSYRIRKMSFGGRVELTRRVRDLIGKAEFLQAGKSEAEQLDSALKYSEVDQEYFLWGLQEIRGLQIDGEAADAGSIASRGPEGLFREIVDAIKAQCSLTDDERKN